MGTKKNQGLHFISVKVAHQICISCVMLICSAVFAFSSDEFQSLLGILCQVTSLIDFLEFPFSEYRNLKMPVKRKMN